MKKQLVHGGLLLVLLVVALMAVACGGAEEPATTAAPTDTTAAPTDTTAASVTDSTAAPTKTETIKFGAISSVTGDMAPAFKAMYDAVKPTEDLLNEMGGFTVGDTQYKIEIVMYDDQSTTAGALTAINKLIEDGVKFVYPPMFMPNSMAIAQLCEENKILRAKSFGAGSMEVNPDNPHFLFSCSGVANIVPFYDYALAKYPDIKKVAVITPDDPGAATYQEMVKAEYAKRGIEVVYWEVYPMPSFDFYPILNKALAAKPDAIDGIFGIPPCSAAIINQSRELGFEGPVFGACTLGDANVLNAMIQPAEYAHDILSYVPDVMSDQMTPAVQKLREKVLAAGAGFELDSVLLLDAFSAIIAGIEGAQSLDADDIIAAIDNGTVKGFEGSFGPATWGSYPDVYGNNHCAQHAAMVTSYVNGKLEFEWLQ